MTATAIAPATPAAPSSLTAAAADKSTAGSDFNLFLKLLTVQMQNQDPLDPMKTDEYTQQLAQYSQIEQTVQQSGTLKDILSQLSTQNMAQASGLIGRDVVFDTAVSGLGSSPASWSYTPARSVSSLVATITDASGKTVSTRTVDPTDTSGRLRWDGTLASGAVAPAGSYTLSFVAADSSGTAVPVVVNSIGTVDSVTQANGTLALGVNGATMPLSSLLRIASAGS